MVSASIVCVTWRDAHFSLDDDNDQDDFLVDTVGWVEEDGLFIRVCSERLPDERGWRSVTRIPIGMVVSQSILVPARQEGLTRP